MICHMCRHPAYAQFAHHQRHILRFRLIPGWHPARRSGGHVFSTADSHDCGENSRTADPHDPWTQSHARLRSRRALSGAYKGAGPGSAAQPAAFSPRFHVPIDASGVSGFEVTICDLKDCRRTALPAIRIHRTGRRDALERAQERARDSSQHRHHAHVRAAA